MTQMAAYEQLRISGQGRSVQQNIAQKHLLTLAPNYGTLFQMNIKLLNYLQILFYLSFLHDNSWILTKNQYIYINMYKICIYKNM